MKTSENMSTNLFNSRTQLFDFYIDSNFNVKENQNIPKLKDEFHQSLSESQLIEMGINLKLDDGFDQQMANQTMRRDWRKFRSLKWRSFLTFLQKKGSVNKEEPKFVFLSGIVNLFFGNYGNRVYAQMFRGLSHIFNKNKFQHYFISLKVSFICIRIKL